MTQIEAVVAAAKSQLGYKEGVNNDTIFGKWWGLNNQPWCAMFVSWCFAQAGAVQLIEAQGSKGFAGCQAMEAWAKKKKMIVKTEKVQAGDILLYDFSKAGKAVHTGIAIGGINPNTHLIDAIEGNTAGDNLGSQANGDGVFLKHRALTTVRAVIRPNWSK
jgi:hypothetical protein